MKPPATASLALRDIETARSRLASGIRITPCIQATSLSQGCGFRLWLKRDDLHRTGSFKERGARHALACLSVSQAARGVVAASAGNHALGLAFHGGQLGVGVTVVVPLSAPEIKVARCRALGAKVIVHGHGFDDAQEYAAEIARATGATLVHPFDDLAVIAGQGTMALEIHEQVKEFDAIVIPVGGGGLLAGVATAMKALRPNVRVIAVEPANAPSFLAASLCGGPVKTLISSTVADGLAVARVGERTFRLAHPLIDDLVTVSEAEIAVAIATLARTTGAIAEGAGAAALAAVLAGRVQGRSVVVPVCGRNINPVVHRQILEHGDAVRAFDWQAKAA